MEKGAVILAAGKGERFHGQKQFAQIDGKAMWQHVYEKTLQAVPKENIVVVGIDIEGGMSRNESVKMGLLHLNRKTERVIVLEAARPLVTVFQIKLLLEDTHPSASFVMPLVNTVVMREGKYVNREEMYELLTPQAFSYPLLLEAIQSDKYRDMTDETRVLYEAFGISPFFIETGDNLYKVTYPRDIAVINELYKDYL